jgi:hypothetical protein
MPADHTTRNLVRPTVNSGKMLHQLREDAEGGVAVFVAGAQGGSWPMADYTRPDRNGSGYKGAAVIGKRMGPTGS